MSNKRQEEEIYTFDIDSDVLTLEEKKMLRSLYRSDVKQCATDFCQHLVSFPKKNSFRKEFYEDNTLCYFKFLKKDIPNDTGKLFKAKGYPVREAPFTIKTFYGDQKLPSRTGFIIETVLKREGAFMVAAIFSILGMIGFLFINDALIRIAGELLMMAICVFSLFYIYNSGKKYFTFFETYRYQ